MLSRTFLFVARISLTCLLTTIVLAAYAQPENDPSTSADFAKTCFPLSVGDQWTYENYSIDTAGVRLPEYYVKLTQTVTGTATKGRKRCWVREWKSVNATGAANSGREYFTYADNGDVMQYSGASKWDTIIAFSLLHTPNGRVDSVFTYASEGSELMTMIQSTHIVNSISVGSSVEVQAGKFKSVELVKVDSVETRVTANGKTYTMPFAIAVTHRFYVPHIGMVESFEEPNGYGLPTHVRNVKELVSYTVH